MVLPVWAEASRLDWDLLFALVASCLGGGGFQLAEKLAVLSQGFLFELRLPVWTGASHLSETSCLNSSRLGWGFLSGQRACHLDWGLPPGMELPVWTGGFLSVLGAPI